MAAVYMVTCIADFIVFPILWSIIQMTSKGQVTLQWQPLTLQGAGLYHIAMGAILGIAVYGRTQEKIRGMDSDVFHVPPNAGTSYIPPGSVATPPAPQYTGSNTRMYPQQGGPRPHLPTKPTQPEFPVL